jgi:hypothetical protein
VSNVLRQAVLLLWNLSSNDDNLRVFRGDEKLVTLVKFALDVYATPYVQRERVVISSTIACIQ